ncbi:MAG: hypothetical protein AAGG75_02840 [Bacteroidota bacterium]
MNFNIKYLLLFFLGTALLSSCTKENLDETNIEENDVTESVVCDLSVTIETTAFGATLMAVANDGTAPYTYLWSTGETTQEIRVTTSGDYEVTVTDAEGCTATATISANNSNPCDLFGVSVEMTAAGSLGAIVTGGTAPYSYLWSTGETTEQITPTASGTYSVTVTDAEGCTSAASAIATVSTPCDRLVVVVDSAMTGAGVVLTATVTGGTAPYAFAWSTGETTSDIIVTTDGTYEVTVTDAEGCVVTASMMISFSTDPCNGLRIFFDTDAAGTMLRAVAQGGTAPFAFLWSTGETTEFISVMSGMTYTVAITDAEGCMVEDSYTIP